MIMNIYSIINACGQDINEQISSITAFEQFCNLDINKITSVAIKGKLVDYDSAYILDKLEAFCREADLIILPGNDFGGDIAVRLAHRLGGSSLCGVTAVNLKEATADKKIYAGNLVGEYKLGNKPWCISVDRSLTTDSEVETRASEEIILPDRGTSFNRSLEFLQEEDGLANARFVVACGQGLKKQALVERVKNGAEAMGASVGASRPVVMNGWTPMNSLVGVSGNMIKPDICITVGASGSPAFFAGIEKSGRIIAINTDPKAPIMTKADVAVVGDGAEVIEELVKLVEG